MTTETSNLRPQPVDFNAVWQTIRGTINKILCLNYVSKDEWGDRFHDIYKLCIAHPESYSDRTYHETRKLLESHVKLIYASVIENPSNMNDLLHIYYEKWQIYQQAIEYLTLLYIYLNTQYVRKFRHGNTELGDDSRSNEKLMEINELGAHLWKMEMIMPLKDNLVQLLLQAINDDRCGKPQNHNVISSVINSFILMERFGNKNKPVLYRELFEEPFLMATSTYYSHEAKLLLQNNDCSNYLEKVLNIINVEKDRLYKLIPNESHQRVIEVVEKCMLGDYLDFFQNECRLMVKNEVSRDLRNMYLLLKSIESGLKIMVDQVELHIKEKGLEVIKCIINSKDDNHIQTFIEEILKVYYHYLHLIENIFSGDKIFMSALDRACTAIINYRENTKQPCRSPEILSRYCDNLLKKSAKNSSEKEMETKITEAIIIFKYISDKDIFQKCYSKMLAKRLIHSQCISMENEECMIQKIKSVCGYEFTSKLQRMFTDVKVCDDFMVGFQTHLENSNIKLPMSFSAYILQACAWPFSQTPVSNFNIPLIFEKAVHEFEHFYLNKFNGRKLNWIFNVSQGEVKFLYTKKLYQITMNTFQIAIILLFENVDELSYEEIQQSTSLNDEQLQRHLQSFTDLKILLINSPSSPLSSSTSSSSSSSLSIQQAKQQQSTSESFPKSTRFLLNKNFASKRMKFKINVPPPKEIQQKEAEQQNASVEEDRKMFLQAAIVRIMKTRKRLRHNALIEEVINQAKQRFNPNVPMIKKAIDSLIEKQYIDRYETSDEYHYMA
ncbi:cullin 2 [Dermatophagoides farinae]|uniref:cullin 2 n=1 Tax=Dermatophagoides farinae TaxID=6954 RepID=UPI003F60898B